MTRMGTAALAQIGPETPWVPAAHTVGAPLAPDETDVPWPCNDTKYISHFPETPGDLVVRLRLRRQRDPRQEGVRPAHRQRHRARRGLARRAHAAAQGHQPARPRVPRRGGVPERLRQDQLRDAASRPSPAGRSRPSATTSPGSRPDPTAACARSTPRPASSASRPEPARTPTPRPSRASGATRSSPTSPCATTATSGGRGMTDKAPDHLIDWTGEHWTPDSGRPPPTRTRGSLWPPPRSRASRTTGRTRRASSSTPSSSAAGVPPTCLWWRRHGTGSTASSWAQRSRPSARRPPKALSGSCDATRSRCSRSAGTTWPTTGSTGWMSGPTSAPPARVPRIFQVNWFRKGDNGDFLWPGFGDNSRVLAWILDRVEGRAAAVESPVGWLPAPGAIDLDGRRRERRRLAGAVPHRPRRAPRRGRRRRGVLRRIRRTRPGRRHRASSRSCAPGCAPRRRSARITDPEGPDDSLASGPSVCPVTVSEHVSRRTAAAPAARASRTGQSRATLIGRSAVRLRGVTSQGAAPPSGRES